MARIAGIDLPPNKRAVISLQYIYGIGNKTAHDIIEGAGIDLATRIFGKQNWRCGMNRKPGYGAKLRANLEPTKGVGRLRQQDGGHRS